MNPTLDILFRVTGAEVPADHGYALFSALSRILETDTSGHCDRSAACRSPKAPRQWYAGRGNVRSASLDSRDRNADLLADSEDV